ncbi:MAG: type VI secretion system contractile sheath large subunit [Planctomycetota bacterium]|nr:type VI secretion system contractile sheath large subunit [Planctomycetota bacterium]
MPQKTSIDQVAVGLSTSPGVQLSTDSASPTPAAPSDPFCIVVMGDFSGRSSRDVRDSTSLSTRPLHWVDRDDFEDVMARLSPRLALKLGTASAESLELEFKDLDDFHPDQLFASVESFDRLKRLRRRLQNSDTFNAAAAQLGAVAAPPAATPTPDPIEPGNLLDSALAATDAGVGAQPKSIVDRLVEQAIAPYVVPAADPRQADLIAGVDSGITDLMRRLLHHPSFQDLESNWRSLWSLVRHLETDGQLKLRLLDVSRDELQDDLCSTAASHQSTFQRRIIDGLVQTPGETRPALFVLCSRFHANTDDVRLLKALARIAATAEAPLLTGGTSELVGSLSFDRVPDYTEWSPLEPEFAAAWNQLRAEPVAKFLGITVPGILLRCGYRDDVEAFDFDEMTPTPKHDEFLWGNGAMLLARLIGEAFSTDGWQLDPERQLEVGDFPMHIFEDAGETIAKPCAEGLLSERAAEKICNAGLIPLLSVRGQDRICIGGVHSVADPSTPLASRWST